jgi:multiple antibiotic resistance protein
MLEDWLALIGGTFGALLPIANPFSTAPVFAALTQRYSPARRGQQARMASIYMASVLLVSLFAGALIMTFFGISLPALRIAGGMIVARVGFRMLDPEPEEELPAAHREEALEAREIAFMPIAMPLLSGPGSIAVTISMATEVDRGSEYLAVAIGVVLVSLASWLVLRSSTRVAAFLGATGMNVLTRLMGFVLVCIGVQFVLRGAVEAATYPGVADALIEAYSRLAGS